MRATEQAGFEETATFLDDFGLRKLTAQQSSDFYDVLVERHRPR